MVDFNNYAERIQHTHKCIETLISLNISDIYGEYAIPNYRIINEF